jgi:hypothetical protein
VENVVEGMEFEPRGVNTDAPASVSELEFVSSDSAEAYPSAAMVDKWMAEDAVVSLAPAIIEVTAAVEEFTTSVAAVTEAMRALLVELTAADFKKAYDDAVILWKPGHIRAKQTGYLLYNSLDLPVETSAHVLQYLFDRAAELASPEAK